jgi:hypothetical protein
MADKTITAANSVFQLVVAGLFPVPQQITGFAADAAFTTDAVERKEVVFGVDGHMSAGYVFSPTITNISIMPDSPSLIVFDAWQQAEQVAQEVYFASATIVLPSIQRKYALTRGVLTSAPPIVSAGRVLAAQQFRITWQSVVGEPY